VPVGLGHEPVREVFAEVELLDGLGRVEQDHAGVGNRAPRGNARRDLGSV
jgi:hypothetical protein